MRSLTIFHSSSVSNAPSGATEVVWIPEQLLQDAPLIDCYPEGDLPSLCSRRRLEPSRLLDRPIRWQGSAHHHVLVNLQLVAALVIIGLKQGR
jgi:hypothetical protein